MQVLNKEQTSCSREIFDDVDGKLETNTQQNAQKINNNNNKKNNTNCDTKNEYGAE